MNFLQQHLGKIILAVALVVTLVSIIKYYAKIKAFLLEVKTELSKVSWSSRHELAGSTFVVIAITFIMAVFIGIIDMFLSRALSFIFR